MSLARNLPIYLLIAAGLGGTVTYGIFTYYQTEVLRNYFVGLWFALLFTLNIIELAYLLTYIASFDKISHYTGITFSSILFFGNLICTICYFRLFDWNASDFALANTLAAGYSLFLLLASYRKQKFLEKGDAFLVQNPENDLVEIQHPPQLLGCFTSTIKAFHLIFILLLTAGAIVSVLTIFPAPGIIYSITMSDGRPTSIHVYCQGNKTDKPVIWIFADSAHGVVDFYGIQHYLVQGGHRVCTQDNPGFGWSGEHLKNQEDYQALFWDQMFNATGEKLPAILIGWGGAGSPVTAYSKRKPQNVHSVFFLDVFSPGVEFYYYQQKHHLTDEELAEYRFNELNSRIGLGKMILGLGIPWGLMPLIIPMSSVPPGYFPSNKKTEFRVQGKSY